jgi:hypothetical protein
VAVVTDEARVLLFDTTSGSLVTNIDTVSAPSSSADRDQVLLIRHDEEPKGFALTRPFRTTTNGVLVRRTPRSAMEALSPGHRWTTHTHRRCRSVGTRGTKHWPLVSANSRTG